VFFVGHREFKTKAGELREVELIQSWKTNVFVAIEDEGARKTIDSQIQKMTDTLDDAQKRALGDHIILFLNAYSKGTWRDYAKFRYPTDKKNLETPNADVFPMFLDGLKQLGITTQSNDTLGVISNYYVKVLPSLVFKEGPIYCLDCWKGLSLSNITILTSKREKLLDCYAAAFADQVASVQTIDSLVDYKLPEGTNGLYARCKFLLNTRRGEATTAYPVYLSSFWDADAGAWVPVKLVVATHRKYSNNYLF